VEKLLMQVLNEIQDLKSQMNSRFDMLETRMANMETKVSSFETEQRKMKEIMATKEDVADIPAIKTAVMETSKAIKRLEATQEKHDRTLDLLSRRSIDQEADIAKLRQTI
jgi:hypothetical protein